MGWNHVTMCNTVTQHYPANMVALFSEFSKLSSDPPPKKIKETSDKSSDVCFLCDVKSISLLPFSLSSSAVVSFSPVQPCLQKAGSPASHCSPAHPYKAAVRASVTPSASQDSADRSNPHLDEHV